MEGYPIEKAEHEADFIKDLMTHDKSLSYSEAESIFTRWVLLKEAVEDGTTARLIKHLDLSASEDIKKLKEYLEPFGNRGIFSRKPFNQEVCRILDDNGRSIFRSKDERPKQGYSYFGHESYISHLLDLFDEIDRLDEIKWYEKHSSYGHFFQKIPDEVLYNLIEAPDDFHGERDFFETAANSTYGSDKFLMTLGSMAELVAFSVNYGYPGWFILKWGWDARKTKSDEFVESHPNSTSIREMVSKADDFFRTFREVFMKFLSNQIQDPDYVMSHESTKVSFEEVILDARAKERYPIAFGDITKILDVEALTPELSTSVKEQTDMLIQKIDRYKAVLDEYNEKMYYAKPLG